MPFTYLTDNFKYDIMGRKPPKKIRLESWGAAQKHAFPAADSFKKQGGKPNGKGNNQKK